MAKNIVIIGAGYAGLELARALEKRSSGLPSDYAIVLIDKRDFFWHMLAGLRAPLDEKTNEGHLIPYDRFFKAGSKDRVVHATAKSITDSAVFTDASGEDAKIEYSALIIATGSTWSDALTIPDGRDEALKFFANQGEEIAAAKSILVIGGGAVGVEFAGEVGEKYQGTRRKDITLVHRGEELLSDAYPLKSRKLLTTQLRALGVDVALRTSTDGKVESKKPVKLSDGRTITPDLVYTAVGNKPNSDLMRAFDSSAISENGCIKVSSTLQVENHPRIFALGDVADIGEVKMAAKTSYQAPVVAANIASLVNSNDTPSKQYKPGTEFIIVTVGTKAGAAVLPIWQLSFGGWMASMVKGKSLFLPKYRATLGY
ncbi:Apoptosis-inducing factor 2 [Savitreella phatthalungensis]